MCEPKLIYSAISSAMSEIGVISKNDRNNQQNFKYRGIDAVMNALQPVLIKNHIFILPEVVDQKREERTTSKGNHLIYSVLKMKYTFYADDGSNVSAIVIGEGMDSGDKASNKAMSVAFKYACFQALCIPTDEMKDPDSETPEETASERSHGNQHSESPQNGAHRVANALIKKFGKEKAPEMLFPITGYKSTKDVPEDRASSIIKMIEDFSELPQ
ncbi:ERF family protein [Ethanoligenens sp.]|uniref:ERF family protein n=1 Tax=Ethanoligenens sp. TaxID=2099655 RepID=UPI0039E817C8